MRIEKIGYGAGTRDLEKQANIARLLVGVTEDATENAASADQVWMLETNLDDISGELIGHTMSRLLEAGALDAYTTPIQMKKNRPAVVLSAICRPADIQRLEEILFRETTTLGIRRWSVSRHILDRKTHQVPTAWGMIDGKLAIAPGGAARFSPEYEACRRVALEHNLPLGEVYDAVKRGFERGESIGDQ